MPAVAPLYPMRAVDLAHRITSGDRSLAIIDVRDGDYIGGHIRGSLHYGYSTFTAMLPELLRRLQNVHTVVFHCALSQQRGPNAAYMYLREVATQQARGRAGVAPLVPQTVYLLEGGFSNWQMMYGREPTLTEGYRPELWRGSWGGYS
ncbi:Cdc25 phosphatase Ibp1 [Sporothrix epigloea]|uniref:Cdc25 phosphatase Ibp1 n=1 Tax=Sporothrix epigloea TaxID=1892477 RepID=A0ABP0DML6_9PEZI